ncbi:hypothetical protein [Halotalea alkalilenta]|nr:hypothetical protein [Halotalea alkalilenta]
MSVIRRATAEAHDFPYDSNDESIPYRVDHRVMLAETALHP